MAVFALSAMALWAQGPGGMDGPPPGGPGGPDGPMMNSGDSVQRILREPSAHRLLGQLTKELKLTAEQKGKIKPVLEQRQRRIEELIQSSRATAQLVARTNGIDQECWADLRASLLEGQQAKFDAFTKKLMDRRERDLKKADAEDEGPPAPPGGPPPLS